MLSDVKTTFTMMYKSLEEKEITCLLKNRKTLPTYLRYVSEYIIDNLSVTTGDGVTINNINILAKLITEDAFYYSQLWKEVAKEFMPAKDKEPVTYKDFVTKDLISTLDPAILNKEPVKTIIKEYNAWKNA